MGGCCWLFWKGGLGVILWHTTPLHSTPLACISGLMAVRRSAVLMFSCPSTRPRGKSRRWPLRSEPFEPTVTPSPFTLLGGVGGGWGVRG